MAMAIEGRVSGLEGTVEQINQRLASLESRLNTQITLTVAMWVTTMIAVLSTLAAVLLRT